MEKKRILILGAGISGLSFAWSFSRLYPEAECTILEKTSKIGGLMDGELKEGFPIERGPRIYKTSRNEEFLTILEEADLLKGVIPSSKEAKSRYIRSGGSLHKSKLTSSFLWPLWKALLKEPFVACDEKEETVFEFAVRRFGKTVADRFFDPLTLGIYAADYKKLSVNACFPIFKRLEKEGGVVLSMFKNAFRKRRKEKRISSSLFSFEGGSSQLLENLKKKMPCKIEYGQEVVSLKKNGDKWDVATLERHFEADLVVLAIPSFAAAPLLKEVSPEAAQLLNTFSYQDVTSVSLGWKEDLLPLSGFGYLVAQSEKEPVLGVLFDSKLFPGLEKRYSLISLMLGSASCSEEDIQSAIFTVCKKHLKIEKSPDLVTYKRMEKAIPLYLLGHLDLVAKLKKSIGSIEGLYLTGNYLEGVSVSDCCRQSRLLAVQIGSELFTD